MLSSLCGAVAGVAISWTYEISANREPQVPEPSSVSTQEKFTALENRVLSLESQLYKVQSEVSTMAMTGDAVLEEEQSSERARERDRDGVGGSDVVSPLLVDADKPFSEDWFWENTEPSFLKLAL